MEADGGDGGLAPPSLLVIINKSKSNYYHQKVLYVSHGQTSK